MNFIFRFLVKEYIFKKLEFSDEKNKDILSILFFT